MRISLIGVGLFALIAMGARDTGCAGSVPASLADESEGSDQTTCGADPCSLDCAAGFVSDDAGCELCECAPVQTASAAACLDDSACSTDEFCDVENFCDAPFGCVDNEDCETVCYGRCIASTPPTDMELCEDSDGKWDAASCGHYACGAVPACRAIIPGCDCGDDANFVDGEGCVIDDACKASCVDNGGCEDNETCVETSEGVECQPPSSGCRNDKDCDEGEICLPTPGAPCSGDSTCDPQAGGVCVADTSCQPVLCDLYCESGFKTDESGCEVCECNTPQCRCALIDAPVCGADGKTYPNACEAGCAAVEIVSEGPCRSECNYNCLIPDPVCGADGVTYTCGADEAKCNGTTVVHEGACKKPECNIQCLVEEPVCGANGVTYPCGADEAECNGTTVVHDGPCDPCDGGHCA